MTFHPELRWAALVTPRGGVGARSLRTVRALSRLAVPPVRGVEVIPLGVGAALRVHRPPETDGPTPALLWIHGGGYVLGTPRQDDLLCRRLARQLGITVAAVQYRLAPEHPYPAALDDCYAALTALAGLPAVLPDRIAIGGASAGGGLAAALALHARDRSEITPVLQLLVYPMLDDRSGARPADRRHRLWTPAANRFGWAAYLGTADPERAVPARRADLAGVPPAWIGVGTRDLFHDEDVDYAHRLITSGVACQLEVVPGAFHGFDRLAARRPVARAFFANQCAALRAAFAAGS